jgi:hypothetical protein
VSITNQQQWIVTFERAALEYMAGRRDLILDETCPLGLEPCAKHGTGCLCLLVGVLLAHIPGKPLILKKQPWAGCMPCCLDRRGPIRYRNTHRRGRSERGTGLGACLPSQSELEDGRVKLRSKQC